MQLYQIHTLHSLNLMLNVKYISIKLDRGGRGKEEENGPCAHMQIPSSHGTVLFYSLIPAGARFPVLLLALQPTKAWLRMLVEIQTSVEVLATACAVSADMGCGAVTSAMS